jgi:Bacterial Ig domain
MRGRTLPILCLLGACGVIGIAPGQAWATPNAQGVSVGTPQDVPVEVTLHGGSNLDSPVSFSIVIGPAHGSLGSIGSPTCSFNPGVTDCTAPVTYTPDPGYSGPDAFTYRVGDADGTADATAGITVVPPPPPGYNATAFGAVDPGATATLALPGLTATLANPGFSSGTAFFAIATYPQSGLDASYDIRAISVGADATLKVTLAYVGNGTPTLLYFDRLTGALVPVRSSSYLIDPVAHTITLVFDGTSTPTITGLTGTRFVATGRQEPPQIQGLRLRPSCEPARSRPPTLRLSLSQAARIDLSIARRKGSRQRARCGSRRRAAPHGRAHFEPPRQLSRGLSAGTSRIRLPRLPPGSYRIRVTATNANGASSATRKLLVLA